MSVIKRSQNIINADFSEVLSEKYLAYALSTIMSRSLPDVRDGLKPVHRRLLYAMSQLKLSPEQGFKKCARVVGDVIGKYHPHGDVAVYDTLVRLAQSFSLRYPLVEGQGNFGSVDGDNAAAMRYTESRLTPLAMYLIADITKGTIEFNPAYDGSDFEPKLMPAMFPNLLTNGSEGIAVGMATNVPPHNLEELVQALIHLIDHPNAEVKELLKFVQGPDFPTGAVIVDTLSNLEKIYSTGKGSITIRASWIIEELGHNMYQIVITEIPYQVQKSRLIENIAILLKDKKIPLVGNIRDESTDQVRIIIEPKNRNCEAKIVMESLFRQTELETKFNYNLNVINTKGLPEVMNLKQILREFLDHRFNIVTRSTKYELAKAEQRLEVLAGLRSVYLNLSKILQIIRDEEEPKSVLKRTLNLTDNQVEAILSIRLRSLCKLEEETIIAESNELTSRSASLNDLLNNSKICWDFIKKQLKTLQKEFGKKTPLGARRTTFATPEAVKVIVNLEALIEREQITVIYSKQGWIRAVKGSIDDVSGLKFKEGDEFSLMLKTYTTDFIIIATSSGRCYTVIADMITKGKGHGEPIRLMIEMSPEGEVIDINIYNPEQKLFFASSNGKGFIVQSSEVFSQTKLGKQIMRLGVNQSCIKVIPIDEQDMITCIGSNRKLLAFALSQIPILKRGSGVALQKLNDAKLQDIQLFNSAEGFKWATLKEEKLQKNFASWVGKRGSVGKIPPFGFLKSNNFSD